MGRQFHVKLGNGFSFWRGRGAGAAGPPSDVRKRSALP